jgi:hypothetical protein
VPPLQAPKKENTHIPLSIQTFFEKSPKGVFRCGIFLKGNHFLRLSAGGTPVNFEII